MTDSMHSFEMRTPFTVNHSVSSIAEHVGRPDLNIDVPIIEKNNYKLRETLVAVRPLSSLMVRDNEEEKAFKLRQLEFTTNFIAVATEFMKGVSDKYFYLFAEVSECIAEDTRVPSSAFKDEDIYSVQVISPFLWLGNYDSNGFISLKLEWNLSLNREQTVEASFFLDKSRQHNGIYSKVDAFPFESQLRTGSGMAVVNTKWWEHFAAKRRERVKVLTVLFTSKDIMDEVFVSSVGLMFKELMTIVFNAYLCSWSITPVREQEEEYGLTMQNAFVPLFDFRRMFLQDMKNDIAKPTASPMEFVYFSDSRNGMHCDLVSGDEWMFANDLVPRKTALMYADELLLITGEERDADEVWFKKISGVNKWRTMLYGMISMVELFERVTFDDVEREEELTNAMVEEWNEAVTAGVRDEMVESISYASGMFPIRQDGSFHQRAHQEYPGIRINDVACHNLVVVPHSQRKGVLHFNLSRSYFNKLSIGWMTANAHGATEQTDTPFFRSALCWSGEDVSTLHWSGYSKSWHDKKPKEMVAAVLGEKIKMVGGTTPIGYVCFRLTDENILGSDGKRSSRTIGKSVAFTLNDGDNTECLADFLRKPHIEEEVKKVFGQVSARAYMLYIENLVFTLFMTDYERWLKLVRIILEGATFRNGKLSAEKSKVNSSSRFFDISKVRSWMSFSHSARTVRLGKEGEKILERQRENRKRRGVNFNDDVILNRSVDSYLFEENLVAFGGEHCPVMKRGRFESSSRR